MDRKEARNMLRDMVECAPHEFTVAECSALTLAIAALSEQGEAVELTVCCGREECGGECGNEWRGMEWVRKSPPPDWQDETATPPAQVTEAMVDRAHDAFTEHRGTFEGEQQVTRDDIRAALQSAQAEPPQDVGRLVDALRKAEAALADIGDADREPGDDLAWCERRAAEALPVVRAALAAHKGEEG